MPGTREVEGDQAPAAHMEQGGKEEHWGMRDRVARLYCPT